MLYISMFPRQEIFFGFRITHNPLIDDVRNYDPNKEYPMHYVVEMGFLFFTITWRQKLSAS